MEGLSWQVQLPSEPWLPALLRGKGPRVLGEPSSHCSSRALIAVDFCKQVSETGNSVATFIALSKVLGVIFDDDICADCSQSCVFSLKILKPFPV